MILPKNVVFLYHVFINYVFFYADDTLMTFDVLATVNSRINEDISIYKHKGRHILKDKNRHLLRYSSVMTGSV